MECCVTGSEDTCGISEVDIFNELKDPEMATTAAAAPRGQFFPSELLYSPPWPMERLFIRKPGRASTLSEAS